MITGSLLSAQESIYWEIVDPTINSDFIESYIDHLIKVDKVEQNSIQASHSIIVQLDVTPDNVELKKLKAMTNVGPTNMQRQGKVQNRRAKK